MKRSVENSARAHRRVPVRRSLRGLLSGSAVFALVVFLCAPPALAALPVPSNCQNDVDGANDQPGQKDVTRYCTDLGDGSPYDLLTLSNWDNTTLTGNNTADVCSLFDTDNDGLANVAVCVTLESSGAGNGNLAVLDTVRLFTCGDTRGDRCTGSSLVGGPYVTTCEVSQQATDPFSPAAPNGPGDQFPTDTQILCGIDLADFGPAGAGAKILDSCSYPSTVPNSDPSDCIAYAECTTNAECDDGNSCTIDTCNVLSGICVRAPNTGQACSDGLYCNGDEICNDLGFCEPDTARDCNDGIACTVDSCDELTDSCINDPRSSLCSDDQHCNGAEICNPLAGCEAGAPPDCNDDVSCTSDSCNEATDSCDNVPSNAACNDGQYCNGVETCDALNGCEAGAVPDCNDGVSCTADSCNEATDSCDNVPNDGACSDGAFCNGAETCDPVNGCEAGTQPNCNDGVACTADSCNEVSDSCDHLPSHAACSDGQYCNGVETCDVVNGCQAGIGPDCGDGVGCTTDACNEATDSCTHTASNAFCSDGLFCTGTETCDPVNDCQPGTPPNCNDGVVCTVDACNEGTNSCDHTPSNAVCNDNQYCNGVETCHVTLGCQAGTAPSCNDGVACTDDACNEVTDSCDNVPDNGNCTDGLFCTGVEICDPDSGCEPGADPCPGPGTLCSEPLDQCVNCLVDADCDNGVFCDGDETCNVGTGTCVAGTAPNCNDGVACTADSCNEATDSCDNEPSDAACSDSKFCTGLETCDPVDGCQAGTPPSCSDGIACTTDACSEILDACTHSANNAACSDGQFCNGAETCDLVAGCQAGTPPNCNDGVDCTVDSCNEAGDACVNAPSDAACGDGAFCNGAETCDAVAGCEAGAAPSCNDGVGCTVDSCNEGTDSCDNVPNDAACSDAQYCNGAETCDPVEDCQAGASPDCDDGIACTVDTCNETSDSCVNVASNAACDDGAFCNGLETCDVLNDCEAGTPVQCADGFACSTDTCNETTDQCEADLSTCFCGDGEVTGSEQCDPPATAGTFEDCNNLVDDDGDGRVDCKDTDCAPGARPAVCDEGCTEDLVCTDVKDDPAVIVYNWDGGHDFLSIHGRFELLEGLNPMTQGISFEISNEYGAIYRAFVDPSQLKPNSKQTRYSFRDRTAKLLGQAGVAGGIYKIGLIRRDFSGVPYVTFRIRAYGDFKFATKVTMNTQFSAGNATGGLTADWTPMRRGWKLPLSEF